jgi:hypothetical protein
VRIPKDKPQAKIAPIKKPSESETLGQMFAKMKKIEDRDETAEEPSVIII